ncbi:MAG: hypothetical protein ACRDAI_05460, partial [Candidatus Rhabdochlamydia sp.]
YKTIDKNQKEIYAQYIEIPEEENLEDLVSHLQSCAVMVGENGVVNFLAVYNTWESTSTAGLFMSGKVNLDVKLIRGTEDLIWSVFQKNTNNNINFNFYATVPSLQCHPETIALVEKIKTEAFENLSLLYCLATDFKVTRVVHCGDFEHQLHKEQHKAQQAQQDHYFRSIFTHKFNPHRYLMFASMYMFRNTAISAAKTTSQFLGGRVLGSVAGLYAGFITFSALSNICNYATFFKNYCFFTESEALCKKQEILQKISVPKTSAYLIEVEPISAPSRIDPRTLVSKFTWAVTIITHQGSGGNHAQIIVEGINDGFYSREMPRTINEENIEEGEKFTYLAEFDPPIKSQLVLPDQHLPFETRTETWIRPSNEVKKMLEDIEQEKRCPKKTRRVFNALGRRSNFYKFSPSKWNLSGEIGDNCFDFAREKVKIIGVILKKSSFEPVVTLVRRHTTDNEVCKALPVTNLI